MISTRAYLPDGTSVWLPATPEDWVDQTATQRGTPVRAGTLSLDGAGTVMWHRQRPLFQGIATLAQSIPSSTWTAVTGLSELVDNWGGHNDSSNTGRYYVPSSSIDDGGGDWFLCSGYVPFNSTDPAHVHIAGLRKTGSATVLEGGKIPGGTGHVLDTMAVDLVQMDGGNNDYIELCGWQNTGSAVNTVVSGKTPSLTVRWVCGSTASFYAATPAAPPVPHVWADTDRVTADATGTVGGHVLVPMNRELRDLVKYLNFPPIARLTAQGGSQTIPSGAGTWTSINYTSTGKSVDNYGGWAAANPSRYVCQRPGLYYVAGYASIAESGGANTGYRAARLLQTYAAGGSQAYAGWTCLPQTSGGTGTALYAIGMVRMAVGDYVELQMSQTQGAGLAVNVSAAGASRLIAVWMAQ